MPRNVGTDTGRLGLLCIESNVTGECALEIATCGHKRLRIPVGLTKFRSRIFLSNSAADRSRIKRNTPHSRSI